MRNRGAIPATWSRHSETVLGHCLARALLAVAADDVSRGRDAHRAATLREKMLALVKATPKASRVAGFIVLWAATLHDGDVETLGIEEFVAQKYASRTSVYRWQREFRLLWPEHETPNALALLVLDAMRRSSDQKLTPLLRIAVRVAA